MPPITDSYDAPSRSGGSVSLPVAAATVLYAGGLAALDAAGHLVPASDTADLTVIGRVAETVDNSAGAAAALSAVIERGVFRYANSAAEAVTKAHVGGPAYVEDDSIVAGDGGTNSIVAGLVVAVDDSGVWVDTTAAPALQDVELLDARVAALEV